MRARRVLRLIAFTARLPGARGTVRPWGCLDCRGFQGGTRFELGWRWWELGAASREEPCFIGKVRKQHSEVEWSRWREQPAWSLHGADQTRWSCCPSLRTSCGRDPRYQLLQPHLVEFPRCIVTSRKLCWSPNPWYPRVWPDLEKCLCRCDQVKGRSLEWTLVQSDWWPYKKRDTKTHVRQKLCDNGGRGWSAVPVSWRIPATAGNQQARQGGVLPCRFQGQCGAASTLILDFYCFCCFPPLSLWCPVTAALGNQYPPLSNNRMRAIKS